MKMLKIAPHLYVCHCRLCGEVLYRESEPDARATIAVHECLLIEQVHNYSPMWDEIAV